MTTSENNIREELLKLADMKEIKHSVTYIKKASEKTLEKIYKDYQRTQFNETNEMLTDTIIGKFSELLQHLDMIEDKSILGKELSENKPFRQDIKLILEYVTPYIPLVGILSGGIITGKHVIYKKINTPTSFPDKNLNQDQPQNNLKEEFKNSSKDVQEEEID